ncbi:hypothetical protein [Cryptosporangium japonicum]|uniref:hypothetical protein n=1 Tax=Cryptosporangium japonicum TaxID=80872 RepID=UPI0031DAF282
MTAGGVDLASGGVEGRSHWPETESVLVRLGLVDKDGRVLEASRPVEAGEAADPDDEPGGAFPIGSVPHPITIAEPVPTFDALVARTRARVKSGDDTQRMSPPGPLGPGPEVSDSAAATPSFGARLVAMLPSREAVRRFLPARAVGRTVERAEDAPGDGSTGSELVNTQVGSEMSESALPEAGDRGTQGEISGAGGPVPLEVAAARPYPGGSAPAPVDSTSRSVPAKKAPRRRPTPAQWRSGARTALVLVMVVATAVPAAVVSWRSALAEVPDAGGALGGGLGVVGLVLLAVGVLKGARSGVAGSTQSLPALLARPGALSVIVGIAVLLCAAIAVG